MKLQIVHWKECNNVSVEATKDVVPIPRYTIRITSWPKLLTQISTNKPSKVFVNLVRNNKRILEGHQSIRDHLSRFQGKIAIQPLIATRVRLKRIPPLSWSP